jgi:hypothetical protein
VIHNRTIVLLAAAVLVGLPAGLEAQGSLSSQGFGYPPGQLSSRARATGGAFGEFDPQSPINPAAISGWGRPALFFQYDPEFRHSESGNVSGRASTSRFPVIAAALPIKQTFMFGAATSTLLDRTWSTNFERKELIGADSVPLLESTRSIGSINDNRIALGWSRSSSLRIGGAVHLITGENSIRIRREFVSTDFDTLDQTSVRGFGGLALSVGGEVKVARTITVAGSYRMGGSLRAYAGDTTLAKGNVPDRFGAAVRYEGIGGMAVAASMAWTQWSRLASLGSSQLVVNDVTDYGIGIEGRGPKWFDNHLPLRVGYRRRALPFSLTGAGKIFESDLSAGFGIPLARTRSNFDFGVERASRWGAAGVTETAWTLSFGMLIRP